MEIDSAVEPPPLQQPSTAEAAPESVNQTQSPSGSMGIEESSGAAAAAKFDDDEEEEGDVCRICRNPGDAENPLRYPCACSGSIKFVHQDCLLQWLNHSNARQCEVCKHPFSFSPVYSENAPARLPFQEFVVGMAMKTCHVLQFFLRLSDAKGHLLGRLASLVAKELLSGQRIVLVRCEKVNLSGSLFRNKLKLKEWYRKSHSTNPRRCGIWHYKAPSRLVWKAIRGMVPRKTKRGEAALGRLKCFDGIPHPYDQRKRQVAPNALKCIRLKNFRQFCTLEDLCHEYGWKSKDIVNQVEERRKAKSAEFYKRKLNKTNLRRKAEQLPELKQLKEKLAQYGY